MGNNIGHIRALEESIRSLQGALSTKDWENGETRRHHDEERSAWEARERERQEEYQRETAKSQEFARGLEQKLSTVMETLDRQTMENNTAKQLAEELERKWRAGIPPEYQPTPEEVQAAKERLYQPHTDFFHCAITGASGCGKSSLVNSIRGVRNNNRGDDSTAATGVTETTSSIQGYRDPSDSGLRNRFVWYDIPGGGTLNVPAWQYFNSQGLFVFDLVIVVIDNRFSELNSNIIKQCRDYKIPYFIVWSKIDQQIRNMAKPQLDEGGRGKKEVIDETRERVVAQTRQNVQANLEKGGLDHSQRVYLLSNDTLGYMMREEFTKLTKYNALIDEPYLVKDCLQAVVMKRYT